MNAKGHAAKLRELNTPARSSTIFMLSGLLSKGAALLLTPVFTRLLSSGEYGTYSLFHSYLSVLIAIGTLELGGGAVLRAFQRHRGSEYSVILSATMVFIPIAVVSVLVFYTLRSRFGGGELFGGAYIMLLASVISNGIINLTLARAKFLYKPTLSVVLSVIQSIAVPLASISLIYLDALSGYSHVAVKIGTATFASAVLAAVLLFIAIHHARHEKARTGRGIDRNFIRECAPNLFRLALPMLPYYLSVMAVSQVDKLALSRYHGTAVLGGYTVAYSAGLSPVFISQGILCALVPWVMRRTRARETERIKLTVSAAIALLSALISVFLSLAPEIFSFLAPKEYRGAEAVMHVAALLPIPLLIMTLESSILCAHEKTNLLALGGAIPAVISIALTYTVTARVSPVAAVITVLAAYIGIAAIGAFNVKRCDGAPPFDPVFSIRALLLTALLSSAYLTLRESLPARLALAALPFASLIYMLKRTAVLLRERQG